MLLLVSPGVLYFSNFWNDGASDLTGEIAVLVYQLLAQEEC